MTRGRLELARRSDGARYSRLTLDREVGGDLVLRAHTMGAAFEAAWGCDDEEITVRIPADQAAKLAFALLGERLKDGPDAARDLVDFCETAGVAFETALWT